MGGEISGGLVVGTDYVCGLGEYVEQDAMEVQLVWVGVKDGKYK